MAGIAFAIGVALAALLALALLSLIAFNAAFAWRAQRIVPPAGRFATIEGVRLHFTDEGNGPAILLLHGLASQLQTYTFGINERLAAHFRLITVDRPGSGYSAAGRSSTADTQVAIFAGLLRELGIGRALVVGHSLGGALAMVMAQKYPELVAGVALIAPVTRAQREVPNPLTQFALRTDVLRWLIGWTIATPIALRRSRKMLNGLFAPDRVVSDFSTRGGAILTMRPWTFRAIARELSEVGGHLPELSSRFDALHLPVHVLYGRGDRVLDYRLHGEGLRDRLSHAQLELCDGGHMVPLTDPQRCADFIAAAASASGLQPGRIDSPAVP